MGQVMYEFHNGIVIMLDHVAWVSTRTYEQKFYLMIGYGPKDSHTAIEYPTWEAMNSGRAYFLKALNA